MDRRIAAWNEVVAQAWSDDQYKAKLLADPVSVLSQAGFQIPKGATVTILVETSPMHRTLILPPKPDAQIVDGAQAASDSVWTVTF
jgi:Nitrile hydratase, alpha chain